MRLICPPLSRLLDGGGDDGAGGGEDERPLSPLRVLDPPLLRPLSPLLLRPLSPLLRRVLTPAELGAVGGVIGPNAEWSGSIGLVVDTGGAARVAGYRLLAFYP